MRFYFIDSEHEKKMLTLHKSQVTFKDHVATYDYEFSDEDNTASKTWFVRNVAGKFYYSQDGRTWEKLPYFAPREQHVQNQRNYKVYVGFYPSGMEGAGAGALVTQMPGKIVKILCQIGDKVQKGQTLLILEAMKMENEIKAQADGILKNVNVKEGQAVEAGFLLMDIESE